MIEERLALIKKRSRYLLYVPDQIYFVVNGQHYGPVGERGSITSGLSLEAEQLMGTYSVADLTQDQDLSSYVAELQSEPVEATQPQE